MYPYHAPPTQAPQGLGGLRAWAEGKGSPSSQQSIGWTQHPPIPATQRVYTLPVQHPARAQAPSDAFNMQLMQMQLRILQARQVNVKQKQLLGQQIISQQRQAMMARPSHSEDLEHDLPQPLFPSNALGHGNAWPREAGEAPPPGSTEAASASQDANRAPVRNIVDDRRDSRQTHSAGSRSALGESSDIEDNPPQNLRPAQPPRPALKTNRKLHELSEQVSQAVDATAKHLNAALDDQLPSDKKHKKVQRREQAKHRQDIESLLQNKPSNAMEILPRWKHLYLHNNPNPSPATIMKPYRLFRVVAWAVAYIVTGPLLAVYKRREKTRERNRREFKRSLDLFAETVDDWLGRAVQLPLASIVQDAAVDFDPKESGGRSRLVQLKVRLRAVVHNLVQLELPPPAHLTTFLSSLVSDGNYFPAAFLWPCETAVLDFDRLGATRCMLPDVDPLFASRVAHKVSVEGEAVDERGDGGGLRTRVLDATRARVLLAHYLLVRVLVYRLCLTPWHGKLCPPPANRHTRRVVHNLRMLGCLLYLLARRVTGDVLPALPERRCTSDAVRSVTAPTEGLAPGRLLSTAPADTPTSTAAGAGATAGVALQSKPSDGPTDAEASAEAVGPTGVLKSVLKLVGFADARPGHEVFKQDSVEFLLLQPRTSVYCSLDELHRLLLTPAQLGGVDSAASEWLDDLVGPLNGWLQRLVEHILVQKVRASGGGGDEAAAATA